MIIPYITLKQQEIPKLLYRYRFLNRLHIQMFMKHKDKHRINSWLKDLTEKEYIEKVEFKNLNPFEKQTKLSVFRIGINGIRYLKTLKGTSRTVINKLYRDTTREESFINHCLSVADICLHLTSKTKENTAYSFSIASDYTDESSSFNFLTELGAHAPDIVYIDEKTKTCYLVTIIDETLPSYRVRKRMRMYLDLYTTSIWEDNTSLPFPIIRVIAPNKATMISLKRYIKKMKEQAQAENIIFEITWKTYDGSENV